MKPKRFAKSTAVSAQTNPAALVTDLRELILSARQTVARGVNAALVRLYWHIGTRIRQEILKVNRAEYGREILSTLSKELVAEFGRGFSWPNLSRMMALAEAFPDEKIVATLSRELGWSHFVELLPLKKHLQRDFSRIELPPKQVFERKLHDAVRLAQARLAQTKDGTPNLI